MLKKLLVVAMIVVSLIVLTTPVSAASYNMAVSYPPCKATSPIMVDPATGIFYFYFGDVVGWLPQGNTIKVGVKATLDWTYPVEVRSSVNYDNLADGYLPLEYITIDPVKYLNEGVWEYFIIKVNIPNKGKYYHNYYQVNLTFAAITNSGYGMALGARLYFVTPKNKKWQ